MKEHKEIWRVMYVFTLWIGVVGSQTHACVKADQISYLKYMRFIIHQLHIDKAVKNCFARYALPSLLFCFLET